MTWVVATPTLLGYALVVSDIRVSWGTSYYFDCLQKIHLVSPSMIAGFAGSVEIGFKFSLGVIFPAACCAWDSLSLWDFDTPLLAAG